MCLLHNIAREKYGDTDLDYCNVMFDTHTNYWENENLNQRARGTNALQRAKEVRDAFVDYFLNNAS